MIKVTNADRWFSKCVRIRSNWTCEFCGVYFEHKKEDLHASHFISRSKYATRYHPENCLSHCRDCHNMLGGHHWNNTNASKFIEHYEQIMGEEARKKMLALSRQTFVNHKYHIDEIALHYRKQYRAIDDLRKQGHTIRIEFFNYQESAEQNQIIRDLEYDHEHKKRQTKNQQELNHYVRKMPRGSQEGRNSGGSYSHDYQQYIFE